MTRSKRLEPVKRLVEEQAEAAAKVLAAAQQQLEQHSLRLTQLQDFRAQYQEQRTRSGESGIDGFRLRDYNAFVGRIDEAVMQQQREVAEAEAEVERVRRQWSALFSKARAIDKVVDRYAMEERRDEERRAQQQSDALAQLRRFLPEGGQ